MRPPVVAAVLALAALLSRGVATTTAVADEVDEGGWRAHDRPDDERIDDDGSDRYDGGDRYDRDVGPDRVPDDVRRYDFEPNQHRHPTLHDDGIRRRHRPSDALPSQQQPPPMRPYWGTMRPYWKPIDPGVTKPQGGGQHRHR